MPPPRSVTERSDFSVYRDGRYLGHAYRESRGRITPLAPDPETKGAFVFEGRFYVLEETLRDMRSAARGVDRSVESRFTASAAALPGRAKSFLADSGYPSLRGLPALPEGELEAGAIWTAPGERSVEVEGASAPILLPFLAEYRLVGKVEYKGRPAIKLVAKFATRYRALAGERPAAPSLVDASGTHDLEITIDAVDFAPFFIRDRFDETFTLSSGARERRSGFNLVFYEESFPLDRGETLLALRGGPLKADEGVEMTRPAPEPPAKPEPKAEGLPPGSGPGALDAGGGEGPLDESEGPLAGAGVELGESPAGIVLRMRDLRFVADSDRILDSESWRLDAIAKALAALPADRRILVEGHSASVGKPAGELELSGRRAARVAESLVARGIAPSRLMFRGLGSSVPLGSNATEEGRALNRRVEITILD